MTEEQALQEVEKLKKVNPKGFCPFIKEDCRVDCKSIIVPEVKVIPGVLDMWGRTGTMPTYYTRDWGCKLIDGAG